MKHGSKKYRLSWAEVGAIARGAGMAAAGGVLAFLADAITHANWSTWSGVAAAGVLSVGVNVGRKFLSDTSNSGR